MSVNCLKCTKIIGKSQYSIQCKKCALWLHRDCANLTIEECDQFAKELKKTNGKRYYCIACTSPASTNDMGGRKCISSTSRETEKCTKKLLKKNENDDSLPLDIYNGEKLDLSMYDIASEEMSVNNGDTALKQEIKYLKTILNHKNFIIHQLQDKIKSLEEKTVTKSTTTTPSAPATTPRTTDVIIKKQKATINTNSAAAASTSKSDLENISRSKLSEIINLQNDLQPNKKETEQKFYNQQNKSEQIQKFKNIVIIGNESEQEQTKDLAIPRKIWLFVSRYRTSYTPKNLENFLKQKFPENNFSCEQIEYNTEYNSFKVGADITIKEKLMCASTWPKGIEVRKFLFHKSNQRRKY